MRNANLRKENPLEIPESQNSLEIRLIAYRFQAQMHLLSNAKEIIAKYADLIYKELCEQNTSIKRHYGGELRTGTVGRNKAIEIISACIILSEGVLVLFNPSDKEPAIIEDAYIFTNYDIAAFEEKLLLEYMENKKLEEQFSENALKAGKTVAGKAASATVGYNVAKLGDLTLLRAERLSKLAKFYDGGHKARMRVQQTVRGKVAQSNMLSQLSSKGKNLSKMSAICKNGGSFVKGRGISSFKNAFRPITLLDALRPIDMGDGTFSGPEETRMQRLIPVELAKYCKKNNNCRWLLIQPSIGQG